jgi:hypothetical protein
VSGALQLQQAPVDPLAERTEVGEVLQAPADPEVVRVVAGGRGAQGAPLLEGLLDVAARVRPVQAGDDAVQQDAGLEPAGRVRAAPAVYQQLDAVRVAKLEVVAEHLLEALPPALRAVEDLGAADLQLEQGQARAEARGRVVGRQRQRQARQPAVEAGLDGRRAGSVAEGLQASRVRAHQEAMV